MRRVTRPNSLFLSAAAQLRYLQLESIISFFNRVLFRNIGRRPLRNPLAADERFLARLMLRDDDQSSNLRRMLRLADLGIEELTAAEVEGIGPQLYFQHAGQGDQQAILTYEDESHGTREWLTLANLALRTLSWGGLLVVDELDRSLHPYLTAELLRLFQDPQTNVHGGQLVFTSHEVTLLRNDNPWRLKRDQVWFTEKQFGATQLFAATDFVNRSDSLKNDLEHLYITGRMGAVPATDDSQLARLALLTSLPVRQVPGQLPLVDISEMRSELDT